MTKFVDTSAHVVTGAHLGVVKPTCEDRAYTSENQLMVFDGATSATDAPSYGEKTPGAFAADVCMAAVQVGMLQNPNATARELLVMANSFIGKHVQDGTQKAHRPIAAGALVRVHNDNTFTWAVAADCQVVVCYDDGTFRPLRKAPAGELYEQEREQVRAALEEELGHAVDLNHPTLKALHEGRVVRHNKDYPVLNGESDFAAFMASPAASKWSGKESLDGVVGIIAFTDGAQWPHFGMFDVDSITLTIGEEGVESYMEELMEELMRAERQDDMALAIGSFVHPYTNSP